MATFGKTIRIYLKDGTATGIRFGEIVNQTLVAVACPRSRVAELRDEAAAQKPGLCFLFGYDAETKENKVYVGEGESVFVRLQSHISTKDFWNEVIFFTSKDDSLTKAHVKYLESRVIEIANSTESYVVENSDSSSAPFLQRPDRDAMEEFLFHVRLMLGVFGHRFLEEANPRKMDGGKQDLPDAMQQENPANLTGLALELNQSGLRAKAIRTDRGFLVLKGSEANHHTACGLQIVYRKLRDRFIELGVLAKSSDNSGKYIFQKDYIFDAPSAAACVILGRSVSGPQTWKSKDGKTLKEIEEEIVGARGAEGRTENEDVGLEDASPK